VKNDRKLPPFNPALHSMPLYATARLEILSAQQGLNKFALKSKLYINAIRQAFDELQQLKSATA
jgi:hypothetical protein